MTGFQIKHIDHIVLRVEDMARSLDFYTGVLSCVIKAQREVRHDPLGCRELDD